MTAEPAALLLTRASGRETSSSPSMGKRRTPVTAAPIGPRRRQARRPGPGAAVPRRHPAYGHRHRWRPSPANPGRDQARSDFRGLCSCHDNGRCCRWGSRGASEGRQQGPQGLSHTRGRLEIREAQIIASASTSRSAPGTHKRDTLTVVMARRGRGGSAPLAPCRNREADDVDEVRGRTFDHIGKGGAVGGQDRGDVVMMKSAWVVMSLRTILRSASIATCPDSCKMVLPPISTRATWECWPAGGGTVAGLSKMIIM